MKQFVIMADTTCDLPEEFAGQYGIELVPAHIILPDKRDLPAMPRWEYFTREEFYSELKASPDSFTTSPPNIAEFAAAFEKYAAEGVPVLCLTISSGISGAYDFACSAKKAALIKYPEATIEVVDSLRFGPAIGLMTLHAAALRDEGKTVDEVKAYLEENKNCFHQAGWLDDLSFVAKKGRLTHAKAFLGTLANVKPIGEFDYNGLTTVIGKAKGAKSAYAALLSYMENTGVDLSEQIIFIAQTNRLEQAIKFKAMIEEKFSPKAVYINDVYCVCGVNVGPGLMAAYYMGKPISSDLSAEKKIIEKALSGE